MVTKIIKLIRNWQGTRPEGGGPDQPQGALLATRRNVKLTEGNTPGTWFQPRQALPILCPAHSLVISNPWKQKYGEWVLFDVTLLTLSTLTQLFLRLVTFSRTMTFMINIHVFNCATQAPVSSCLGFILFVCDCKQFLASHLALSETLPQFVMANVVGAHF